VKGVAANLGARGVQAVAGELELALRKGEEAARIELLRQDLDATLAPLVAQLRAALGATVPAATPAGAEIAPARLRAVVAQMCQYLADSDSAATECLEGNREVFASLLPSAEFSSFEKLVQSYAFEDALAQLQLAAPEACATGQAS